MRKVGTGYLIQKCLCSNARGLQFDGIQPEVTLCLLKCGFIWQLLLTWGELPNSAAVSHSQKYDNVRTLWPSKENLRVLNYCTCNTVVSAIKLQQGKTTRVRILFPFFTAVEIKFILVKFHSFSFLPRAVCSCFLQQLSEQSRTVGLGLFMDWNANVPTYCSLPLTEDTLFSKSFLWPAAEHDFSITLHLLSSQSCCFSCLTAIRFQAAHPSSSSAVWVSWVLTCWIADDCTHMEALTLSCLENFLCGQQ